MQRISERHDTRDAQLPVVIRGSEMGGDAPAHRLAADKHPVASEVLACLRDRLSITRFEDVGAIGHAAMPLGVQEIERHDVDASPGKPARELHHERALLSGSGAVRQHERGHRRRDNRAVTQRRCLRVADHDRQRRLGQKIAIGLTGDPVPPSTGNGANVIANS